ncbi:hypothetical protein [Bradyrhizobium vignae]|uniref:hypothetical protein n=1 Tax=Bradyrhizobium vignae TaxID=1549949 RepID=UPI0011AEBC66|nr:hypothetical protein [Bradyrhizobium vignae]
MLTLSRETGISVEVERCSAPALAAIHSLAAEVGQAAACIDAETGLLSRSSALEFFQSLNSPRVQPPPPEHLELAMRVGRLSRNARRRLLDDVGILLSGSVPGDRNVPMLKDWNFGFPPGAVVVEIVGAAGANRRLVAEPVVAMDRLRRCVRTTQGLYRLRSDEAVTETISHEG